jgi:hypothetical protein
MKGRNRRQRVVLLVLTLAAVLVSTTAVAAKLGGGGGYDLSWSSVDGGGYMYSAGGRYSLGGTIGQADAGSLSGGSYQLNGGFWAAEGPYITQVPLVIKH